MKRIVLTGILIAAVTCSSPVYAREFSLANSNEKEVREGDFIAIVQEDDTVVLTGVDSHEEECADIPAEIAGYPVSVIGERAFEYKVFDDLTIPETVLLIDEDAFSYITVKNSLSLPENVVLMEDAFSYADLPEEITIPQGAYLDEGAFSYIYGAESVRIGDGARLGEDCFSYADDVTSVTIGANAEIGEDAFSYCDNLETVTCGEGATLGDGAFTNCPKLNAPKSSGSEEPPEECTEDTAAQGGGVLAASFSENDTLSIAKKDTPSISENDTISLPEKDAESAPKAAAAFESAFSDYYDYENPDGTYTYYFTQGVFVTMDKDWYQKTMVIPTERGATFYHKASYQAFQEKYGFEGGRLFTISASVNTDFRNLPSFEYIGFDEEEVMNYFAVLPTDYQAYADDESIRAEYDSLWSGVKDVIAGIELEEAAD